MSEGDGSNPRSAGGRFLDAGSARRVVSYAQNAEDVRLLRVFDCVERGFYVDVGAAHPTIGSVTKLFYDRGWSGINIEPGPAFAELERQRVRDVNLNVAVGEPAGPIDFFVTYPDTGLSTTDMAAHRHLESVISEVRQIRVECRPLKDILDAAAAGRTIHFLKIDVEGSEPAVLRSAGLGVHRPIVIVVESIKSWARISTHLSWEGYLADAGYKFAAFDGINRFYVRSEDSELADILGYPISPLDNYSIQSPPDPAPQGADPAAAALHSAEVRAQVAGMRATVMQVRTQEALEQAKTATGRLRATEARVHALAARIHRMEATVTRKAAKRLRELGQEVRDGAKSLSVVCGRSGRNILKRCAPVLGIHWIYRRELQIPGAWGIEPPLLATAKKLKKRIKRRLKQATEAKKPERRKRFVRGRLEAVRASLGPPGRLPEPQRLAELGDALRAAERHNDDRLLKRHYSPAMREALLEAEFAACLSNRPHNPVTADSREAARNALVVDARCLQDSNYVGRGVGAHAAAVLQALRDTAKGGERIVLLLDPNLAPPDAAVRAMADASIFSPAGIDLATVKLFVCLSPMTAPIGAAMRFLLADGICCATVVYDFIPARFPDYYLRSPESRISYQARILALQAYDMFLPISGSTASELQMRLPQVAEGQVRISGVADPLRGAGEARAGEAALSRLPERYILAPTGGDSRKNLLALMAAEGMRRKRGGRPISIVVVGRLMTAQRKMAKKLAKRVGISSSDLIFLQGVSSAALLEIYRRATICVVPSLAEGFSLPVAEAVLRGTPVVASDIPVHRELIGRSWWLANPCSPRRFAAAIERVLERRVDVNNAQRRNLGDLADSAAVRSRLASAFDDLRDHRKGTPTEDPAGNATVDNRTGTLRVAVATPWPPQRSGIADYSAHVFQSLAQHVDLTILATTNDSKRGGRIEFRPISAAAYLDAGYDVVISVLGNSHFHLPALEYLCALGGPAVSHDNRMLELYCYMHDADSVARLLSTPTRVVHPTEVPRYLAALDELPNLGYWQIAKAAHPLFVHSPRLAKRVARETGARPIALPFVPYFLPSDERLTDDALHAARIRCEISEDMIHIATFGAVDLRTKGADILVDAMSWLRLWGISGRLHFVGGTAAPERDRLLRQARSDGVEDRLVFHEHVDRDRYKDMLLAVDVAVQLRTSALLSLSGALMDCIAFGVPTVVTEAMKAEVDAPTYVTSVADRPSSLIVAEGIRDLARQRRERLAQIDAERRRYLESRSAETYASELLRQLWPARAGS